jgi:hypothetical protein
MPRAPSPSATLLLLALATPAAAQSEAAATMRLAPPIAGLGPIAPLAAPVEVTRAGWGPFQRVCTTTTDLNRGAPREGPTLCLRLAAQREAGGWRIRAQPDAPGTGASPLYAMLRRDDGSVTEVTAEPPGGTAPLSAQQGAALLATGRATLESLGLARRRLAPNTRFALPLPQVMEGRMPNAPGLDCLPEGRARLAGREVVAARCLARLEGRLTANALATVTIAGQFAIDIETGLLVAQSHATRVETFAETAGRPPRSNGVVITLSRTRME